MGATQFEVRDQHFQTRIRESFDRQRLMASIGAELITIAPGEVEIALPFHPDLTQQHGYLHAAVVTAIADNACGYAALTLMPADADVLSVEFKVNLLAPAVGHRFIARGRVLRPGRRITVCAGDVFAEPKDGGEERLVATMLATMTAVFHRSDGEP